VTRELIRAPGHDRLLSLGGLAGAWIEHFCIHGPGDVQGRHLKKHKGIIYVPDDEPLPLDDEIHGLFMDCYAHNKKGRRLYDDVFFSRAKGRAKSEIAGFLVLFEAFGPCRFKGFAKGGEVYKERDFRYVYTAGEPMGEKVTYPFIRCLATEEGQAGNTYDNVYYNLTEGPLAEGLPRNAAGMTRTLLPGGGEIRPSTASSASKDGGKESFVVYDETHLYVLPELKAMYATVQRNKSKRKKATPWGLQTSTMYQTGEESQAESTHTRAKLIKDGVSKETRLLFDHREAPEGVDLESREEIIKALREVYGPFADAMDLDGMVDREFFNSEVDIEQTIRYYFNQPTAARNAWTDQEFWDNNKKTYDQCPPLVSGEEIVMFFDGSTSDDSTGLLAIRCSDGVPFLLGAWEKDPTGQRAKKPRHEKATDRKWRISRVAVDNVVDAAHTDYKVLAFRADVRDFESYVDKWGEKYGASYLIPATVGRFPHAVAWDMRGKQKEFTEATERCLIDITNFDLPHHGDTRLRRHVLNARRASNRYGVSISKTGRESPYKIDFAVCLIGARQLWRDLLVSPEWQKRKKKRSGRVW